MERSYRLDFLSSSVEVERCRKFEEVLVLGPCIAGDLVVELNVELLEVRWYLDAMVAVGRVMRVIDGIESCFEFWECYQFFVRDDLLLCFDGLKYQLEVILSAVYWCFFREEEVLFFVVWMFFFVGMEDDVDTLIGELVRIVWLEAIDVEECVLKGGSYE